MKIYTPITVNFACFLAGMIGVWCVTHSFWALGWCWKASVRNAQAKQRLAVKKRSGGICEFGYVANIIERTDSGEERFKEKGWIGCSGSATDIAHIVPRRECGKARDLPEVVVHACRVHHILYDSPLTQRSNRPRVPKELLVCARAAIKAANLKAPLKKSVRERLK